MAPGEKGDQEPFHHGFLATRERTAETNCWLDSKVLDVTRLIVGLE
jgi:hypothetical protein